MESEAETVCWRLQGATNCDKAVCGERRFVLELVFTIL